jgi:hypothetical protein
MGFRDWLRRDVDKTQEMMYFYDVGCEVVGAPTGGWWRSTLAERMDRISIGRKEVQRRQRLGQEAADRALGVAYRQGKAQRGRDVQFKQDGITVKVQNGYSRKYDRYTTDIILIDPGRPGEHLHYVLDEDGNEIHQAWTANHS